MKVISPQYALADNVFCFTTTKEGGDDAGERRQYQGLNLAKHVSDVPERVDNNRAVLLSYLHAQCSHKALAPKDNSLPLDNESQKQLNLHFLNQVHSNVVLDYSDLPSTNVDADAIFTDKAGVPLSVLTADCLPIVLASTLNNELAAVHAGWKGLLNGIIKNAIVKFASPHSAISAWIGPSICQRHFEVGHEVAKEFSRFKSCVASKPNKAGALQKYHVDLSLVAAQQLNALGITHIQKSEACTYCRDELYSYRQAIHEGFSDCGRMATVTIRV